MAAQKSPWIVHLVELLVCGIPAAVSMQAQVHSSARAHGRQQPLPRTQMGYQHAIEHDRTTLTCSYDSRIGDWLKNICNPDLSYCDACAEHCNADPHCKYWWQNDDAEGGTASGDCLLYAGCSTTRTTSRTGTTYSKPLVWPADLERWAHGPLFSKNSSLHHTTIKSATGSYDLTVAAFDTWEDQGVSGELNNGAGWETSHIAYLCDKFKDNGESGNFLDVGANIGTFTIPMADCIQHRGGRVIAVEGMPPIADHLAVGLLANNLRNVDLYNYAVGAPDDPKKVTMSLNPVNKGGSAVKGNKPFTEMSDDQLQDLFHPGNKQKRRKSAPRVIVKEYEVPLTTGDLMLQNNPAMKAIHVAKVDIEGHEGHFLQGSQELFSKYPPCILTIELIPEWLERAGTPVEGILDMLVGWGYTHVPTADKFRTQNHQSQTKTILQLDMASCLDRVAKYDAEIVKPMTNFSDPDALSAALAREALAQELDGMLVRPGQ